MKLSDYMEKKKLDDAALVSLLEKAGLKRDRTTVSRWRKETIRPDWEAIRVLESATGRKVTAGDFLELAGK